MNNMFVFGFVVGYLIPFIENLVVEPIRNKWRKDCKFDCSKCKVWDCSKKDCLRYKEKYLSKKDCVDYEK